MNNTKVKRLLSSLAATAMALTMVFAPAMTTNAAGPTGGTYAAPADAFFAKHFFVPAGVTAPTSAMTFTFDYTKVSKDGATTAAALGAMPTMNSQNIVLDPSTAANTTAGGGTTYAASSSNIRLDAAVAFPTPGIYVYNLKENSTFSGYTLASNETMNMSPAEYQVKIQVALDPTSGDTYVQNIVTEIMTDNNGAAGGATKTTPDGDDTTPLANAMKFINNFDATAAPGPSPTDGLKITKTVDNSAGITIDGTIVKDVFPFSITVKRPAGGALPAATYTYNKYETATGSAVPGTITFAAGSDTATITENLKDTGYIVWDAARVGYTYVIEENSGTAMTQYNTAYATTDGLGTATSDSGMTTASKTLVTGTNASVCTNTTYDTATPTGLLVNNLPFIALILVALGAAAAYLGVKRFRSVR